MQKNANKPLRLVQGNDEEMNRTVELEGLLLHKSKFILPIVCPSCKNVVGYLNSNTGYYVIQGQYCAQCGTQVKTAAEE